MSHVDEGLIHAWIDGAFPPGNEQGEEIEAHIALCVDCRVRVEKARELKERAQVVMHRLAPDAIVAPPFEEIVARRDHTRVATGETFGPSAAAPQAAKLPKRRRTDVLPIPLAWAATVILAVGAGWMGRELMLNSDSIGADSEAVQSLTPAADADSSAPLRMESEGSAAAPALPQSSVADAGTRPRETADAVRNDARSRETPREAVTGFAPPVAQLKAADSASRQMAAAGARVDSAPIMLRGIDAAVALPRAERRTLAASVSTVTADSLSRVTADLSVLTAYVRASADSLWTAEPYAVVGLIGYEPIARLDDAEPVNSERAVVDSLELLRLVYVVEGDTVEVVQQLEQTQVALEAIVVTGSASGADSVRMRADSTAAARRPEPALPPPAARADSERREVERAAVALDTASALESRNIVTLRDPDRVVLLIGRGTSASLEALATRIR